MKISEVDHVALVVSDIERSLAFYKDVLGFEKIFDLPLGGEAFENLLQLKQGTRLRSIMMKQKRARGMVELVQFDIPIDPAEKSKPIGAPGFLLMSFELFDEDLEDVFMRLKEKGVPVYSKPQILEFQGVGRIKAIVLQDPDGNMIELIQLPPKDKAK